jgi:hypothetical protein
MTIVILAGGRARTSVGMTSFWSIRCRDRVEVLSIGRRDDVDRMSMKCRYDVDVMSMA